VPTAAAVCPGHTNVVVILGALIADLLDYVFDVQCLLDRQLGIFGTLEDNVEIDFNENYY
jgi:hypothetical protein